LHQDLQRLANERHHNPTRSAIYDLLDDPQASPAAASPVGFWSEEVDPTSAGEGSQQIRSAVIPAMQNAIEVLGNPFGHVRGSDIGTFATGDPSVPSWWN
jgi:hypothetical protein